MTGPQSLETGEVEFVRTEPLAVIASAVQLLEHERQVFLSGRYEELAGIIGEKERILDRLERMVHLVVPNAEIITALRNLIEISRRNEQIIQAGRQGLSHARRRLKAIEEMKAGAVAYAEDGTQIRSNADLLKDDKTA